MRPGRTPRGDAGVAPGTVACGAELERFLRSGKVARYRRVVHLYAAYGSNLDPARMRATCPRSPLVGTGWLEGWRLTFAGADLGWESAVATVVEAPGERVFTALYDLDAADMAVLDELEGYNSGLYRKIHSLAATLEANRPVWTYVFEGFEGGLPSQWYLDEILRAAEAAGAPVDYVEALRKRPTADG